MELLIIFVLVLLNGVLAMSEIAVVSARPSRLKDMADSGSSGAAAALELAQNPNKFLSTVQIGITLVGIVAGAFGGTTVGRRFGTWLGDTLPWLDAYSNIIGISLVVLLTTYLSLVIGELVPKRLSIEYPERVASMVAPAMTVLSRVMTPVVVVLSASMNGILRLMGVQPNEESHVTESEVISMIQDGTGVGEFEESEAEMVQGVFQLDDRRVDEIMTPRTDIHWLDINSPLDEIRRQITETPHHFYPLCETELDEVLGIIRAKDLLVPAFEQQTLDLRSIMRRPVFLPEMAVASRALETFKATGVHVGLVIGEHGGIEGLLTLNDVIREIVGDIDAVDQEVVRRTDGSYLLDGRMPLTRFEEFLPGKVRVPDDEIGDYHTLAGFVMARLERMPEIADVFDWGGLTFEVMDMDRKRVDRVLVQEVQQNAEERE